MVTLTDRQREVLTLISHGHTDKQTAKALWLSEHTIHDHVRYACRALGARNRVQAVAIALTDGHIT